MRYQLALPPEPAGPLWDDGGMRYKKGPDGMWRDTDGYARSWPELLQYCSPLDDESPTRQVWGQAKPGAYYWAEGIDSTRNSRVRGIGFLNAQRLLTVPPVGIQQGGTLSPDDDADRLDELTPILAVPADTLLNLVNARRPEAAREYQAEILDWLNTHSQKHWEDD